MLRKTSPLLPPFPPCRVVAGADARIIATPLRELKTAFTSMDGCFRRLDDVAGTVSQKLSNVLGGAPSKTWNTGLPLLPKVSIPEESHALLADGDKVVRGAAVIVLDLIAVVAIVEVSVIVASCTFVSVVVALVLQLLDPLSIFAVDVELHLEVMWLI